MIQYPGDQAPFWDRMQWLADVHAKARNDARANGDWKAYWYWVENDPMAPAICKIEARVHNVGPARVALEYAVMAAVMFGIVLPLLNHFVPVK